MNQSFLSKFIVSACFIAMWGCQSSSDSAPPKKMPSMDQAPCHDGNGNKECTDEAKKEEPKAAESVSAPVAQEEAKPSEPQAAVEKPAALEPSAAAEMPVVDPAATPAAPQMQAAESAPAAPAPVAEMDAPVVPVAL